ncbi:MAG: NADH-quinone oxidoreductase subunit C, partial [Tunicatimonas sp.]|uniref:NADH-quinone oxidoreductase subunit C n=1 Tax=Tunicatimonas sp. TaxID=1940096 RepID=UPI003C78A1F8
MNVHEIAQRIEEEFGADTVVEVVESASPAIIQIELERLLGACQFLHQTEGLYFDYLSCLTGIDNGPDAGTMEVIYTLNSIPYEHQVSLKIVVDRNQTGEPMPKVPSVVSVWKSADWHEREVYDLLGIQFTNHP